MPLFDVELNRLADSIGASDLTIYLHTAAPTNAAPTNGRVTVGGGTYESGAALADGDISDASAGDISNNDALAFGAADEAAGLVTHWVAYRGSDPVAWGTLDNTTIANGDSFTINAGALDINGSTP